jgi:hypothetical protein
VDGPGGSGRPAGQGKAHDRDVDGGNGEHHLAQKPE